MASQTDGRTLPWRILGRAVRPYALAVSQQTEEGGSRDRA